MSKSTTSKKTPKPLAGRVAVVAGATRGAGRGIARALAEAGAAVICTGRSVEGQPSPYKRPETIEQTAQLITAAGGRAAAVPVDHTVEAEVADLFKRVRSDYRRLDVLVNAVAGEDPLLRQWAPFWEAELTHADLALRQALVSHMITAKHAAPLMMQQKSGLIAEITENDIMMAGGNPLSQTVKLALKGLVLAFATELKPHGVAVVAITPGFLRSESMLEQHGVTEQNWRDAGKIDKNFLESESPLFIGRAVAALAADTDVLARTGQLLSSFELARHYQFTDGDGRRPDWGKLAIDFSGLPASLVERFRTETDLQLRWLRTVRERTQLFQAKIPKKARRTSRARTN